MIILKDIWWSNWFSYGQNNHINFTDSALTQISGKNGSGKTSIPIILEELLYSKNHLGKKKSQLVNRYLKNPVLYAKLDFSIEDDDYSLELSRKSTASLTLKKNGIDISSHTSTATYKTLQNILGTSLDFKTFYQLIYQSSTTSLEFLTATDTTRKKFLVSLFNLNKYLSIHESFKKVASDINTQVTEFKAKMSSVSNWIEKHKKVDLTEKDIKELPHIDDSVIDKLAELQGELANIWITNKRVNENNQYKEMLKLIDTSILSENITITEDIESIKKNIKDLESKYVQTKTIKTIHEEKIKKLNNLKEKECPTCFQKIDMEKSVSLIKDLETEIEKVNNELNTLSDKIKELKISENNIIEKQNKLRKKEKVQKEMVDLLSKIDDDVPEETLIENDLKKEIDAINKQIKKSREEIDQISKYNSEASAHNSKVSVIKEQLVEYQKELETLDKSYSELIKVYNKVSLLKKVFSTNGLLSYKLDFLVKDLEYQINKYLEELSDGRFLLIFNLNDEKLNIDIIDDGATIGIEELSAGELARINAATLLAIRSLMSSISSTKINILFLDEIMGVLDDIGKEKLIEVLYEEKDLNTFLVSHEYSHPLIPKINVVKEKKISRIENG